MKPFLLIAGSSYYPSPYTDDWRGTYETREEAEAQITKEENNEYFSRGPRKGQIKESKNIYRLKDEYESIVDWYEIIDLRDWIDPASEDDGVW